MEAVFIWVWGLMHSSGKFYKNGLTPLWAGFVVVCWPRTEPDVTSYASNIHTAALTVYPRAAVLLCAATALLTQQHSAHVCGDVFPWVEAIWQYM